MAAPVFRAIGTRVSTGTEGDPISPGLPSGWQAGDTHLLVEVMSCFGVQEDRLPTYPSPPTGYTEALARFYGGDTVGSNSRQVAVRISRRTAQGGDSAPSVQSNTDQGAYTAGTFTHQAYIIGASGAEATDPIDVIQASNFDGDTTSLSEAGVTTTVNECLVVAIVALADDGIAGSSPAFTDPASPTERLDETTTTGGDQFAYVATGEKATAGATGNFTLTLSATDPGAVVVLALTPPDATADPGEHRGVGTIASTTTQGGEITPGAPADVATGDEVLIVEVCSLFGSENARPSTFRSPPADWEVASAGATSAEVLQVPEGGNNRTVRVRVLRRVGGWQAGDAMPAIRTNTDAVSFTADTYIYRAKAFAVVGDVDLDAVTVTGAGNTAAVSSPGITMSAAGRVYAITAVGDDNTFASQAFATEPTTGTEHSDETTTDGGDQGLAIWSGEKTGAGATGAFSATMSATDPVAVIVLGFVEAGEAETPVTGPWSAAATSSLFVSDDTPAAPPSAGGVLPLRRIVERHAPAMALVRLLGPNGPWTVLGADGARGVWFEQLTMDADRWGPNTAGLSLRRDPAITWPDLSLFSSAEIEVAGRLVWSGRVNSVPGTRGDERSVSLSLEGWQRHLEDEPQLRGYVHRDLSAWRDIRSFLGADLTDFVATPQVNGDGGGFVIGWAKDAAVTGGEAVGIMIDTDEIGFRPERVVIEVQAVNPNSFFDLYVRSSETDDPIGSAVTDYGSSSFSTISTTGAFYGNTISGGGRRYVSIFLYVPTGSDTATTDHLLRIASVRLFRSTAIESSSESTLKASSVVGDMVALCPALAQTTEAIQSTSFSIPSFALQGYQTPRAMIDAVNAYEGYQVSVDARRRLVYRPRPTRASVEVGEWSGAEWQDQSIAASEEVVDTVIVEGRDGSERLIRETVSRDVPALTRQGITRGFVLQAQGVVTSASAQAIGAAWISERARTRMRGSLRLTGQGSIRNARTGEPLHPADMLRLTGERIALTNMADPDTGGWYREGEIAAVSYDHDGQSCQVSIDEQRGRLEERLARFGALQGARTG